MIIKAPIFPLNTDMKTELRCPCVDRMSVTFFCLETKRCLKLISLELKSTITTRSTLLSSHSVALLLEGNLVMDTMMMMIV